MPSQEEIWTEILEDFGKLVFECLENGTESTMTIGDDKNAVTVEIFRSKDPDSDFNEAAKRKLITKGVTH